MEGGCLIRRKLLDNLKCVLLLNDIRKIIPGSRVGRIIAPHRYPHPNPCEYVTSYV